MFVSSVTSESNVSVCRSRVRCVPCKEGTGLSRHWLCASLCCGVLKGDSQYFLVFSGLSS
jgi:hypothetical protein